eukprot:TRINITY_DN12887_c0_g1_i1.p1 TRINITY_DN12887_c0_g1~~TRINITY_DN12887_c0_g1_i1.p1  ORF type:complete len:393 (+),score=33.73 TRINITY_DN12887_c0_g1_i1:391-1569(+)
MFVNNLSRCDPMETTENTSYGSPCVLDLPRELQPLILIELDLNSLPAAFCVCQMWARYTHSDSFYEQFYLKLYQQTLPEIEQLKAMKKSWKWLLWASSPLHESTRGFSGLGTKAIEAGIYTGEWQNDLRHGFGIQWWTQSTLLQYRVRYIGFWKEGKRNGDGFCHWSSGSRFEGTFVDDQICGEGTFTWKNGDSYQGSFDKNGEKCGKGTFSWISGNSYTGDWKHNKREGEGIFKWHNGDTYEGQWHDDMKVGYGVLTWNNGNRFEGQWAQGHKREGIITEFVSGRQITGDFSNDLVFEDHLHPKIKDCIARKVCTFSFSGKSSYLQYLWQTNERGDRTHGVCAVCRELCVPKNKTKLLEPNKCYFGGNFWCDCGSGHLDTPCRASGEYTHL